MNKFETIVALLDTSRRPKILIVDDQVINILALSSVFETDFDVLVATEGQKSVELAVQEKPDVMLLDINMPGMTGYDVLNRLQQLPETNGIPVIFITGETDVDTEELGLNLGAVDYITKPFSNAIVRARVLTHVLNKLQHDKLKQLSEVDALTGMYNRRRFDEALKFYWRISVREHVPLSLLIMDIDYFKKYNDRYGHVMGDVCLRQVGQMIKHSVRRESDVCCRYGGEEFVCLLPYTDLIGAINRAETLLNGIRELAIEHSDSDVTDVVTMSIGVNSIVASMGDEADFVIDADKALYRSKSSGRNCYRLAKGCLSDDNNAD